MAKKSSTKTSVEVAADTGPEAGAGPDDLATGTAADGQTPAPDAPAAPEPDPAQVLVEKEAELKGLRDQILYLHAEQENFKKRTEKRYRDMLEYAAEPLLRDLLPVLENLERASAHAHEGGTEGFAALLEGLDHVIAHFAETLARHGAEPVPTNGVKFDPELHEAMAQVPGNEDGLVADVYEKGYRFKSRLLRPAKVTVTKVAPGSGDG